VTKGRGKKKRKKEKDRKKKKKQRQGSQKQIDGGLVTMNNPIPAGDGTQNGAVAKSREQRRDTGINNKKSTPKNSRDT